MKDILSQCGLCGRWQKVNPFRSDTLYVKRKNVGFSRIVCDECERKIINFPKVDKDAVL